MSQEETPAEHPNPNREPSLCSRLNMITTLYLIRLQKMGLCVIIQELIQSLWEPSYDESVQVPKYFKFYNSHFRDLFVLLIL